MTLVPRAAVTLIAAGPLAVFLAAPAAADPPDVTLTAAVAGSTVTATITNDTGADIVCGLGGLHAEPELPR